MQWSDRCDYDAFLDPRVRRLNGNKYKKWMEFVALSMRGEHKGVVSYLDDEIAYELDVSLRDWRDLREVWTLRELLLVRALPNGRRLYAVALWFLPDQKVTVTKDNQEKVVTADGRKAEWWAGPDSVETSLSLLEEPPDGLEEPNANGKPDGAERTFLSKWRARCRSVHNYLPSDAEERKRRRYYHAYRQWKDALKDALTPPTRAQEAAFEERWYATPEPAPPLQSPPDMPPDAPLGTGEQAAFGNTATPETPQESSVTNGEVLPLPVTDSIVLEEIEAETNNSNSPSEPLPAPAAVTDIGNGNDKTIILDAVCEELVVLYGFSPDVAAQYRTQGQYTESHLREKMRWISIEHPGEEAHHAGKLRNYIEGKWKASSRVLIAVQQVDRERQADAQRRQRATSDAQEQARLRAERQRQAARDALWRDMAQTERDRLEEQAFAQLQQANLRLVAEYVHKPADRKRGLIRALMQPYLDALLETALQDQEAPLGDGHSGLLPVGSVPEVQAETGAVGTSSDADIEAWQAVIDAMVGE